MSFAMSEKIQKILTGLKQNEAGKIVLKKAGLTGLNITHDGEYDAHRQITKNILDEDYCIRNCSNHSAEINKESPNSPIVIGIFPRRAQKLTAKIFQPLADYLSQRLDRKVKLVTSKTFKEFWAGVKERRFDLVHLNQFHYVKSHKLYGYDVVLKNEEFGSDTVTPAIFVRKDSNINSLQELKNKSIIFGPKMAMVSYVGNAYQLKQAGLKKNDYEKIVAINPLDGCIAMFKGESNACGAGMVLMKLPYVKKFIDFSKVKVLSKGNPFTHLTWAAKSNINPKLREDIQNILSELKRTEKGKKVLKQARLSNLKVSNDEEYDVHRIQIKAVSSEDYCVRNCGIASKSKIDAAKKPPLYVSIFPRREKRKTYTMFKPLTDYLSKELNREVILETHKTFKDLWRGIKDRRYDLIHVNQFQYVKSHKLYGYDVILKNEEHKVTTITPAIYVRKDSGINSLQDLKGKRIIFGGGKLAMVSYVGNLQLLQKAGLKDSDYNWKFANTPPNGCRAMFLGQADACGAAKVLLNMPVFKNMVDINQVKTLAENIPLANVNWAVNRVLDNETREQIRTALLKLNNNDKGKKILKGAGMSGIVQASEQEYDTHRSIILDVLKEQY